MFKKEYHPLDSRHADNRRATAKVAARREAVRMGTPVQQAPNAPHARAETEGETGAATGGETIAHRAERDARVSDPAQDHTFAQQGEEALRDRISAAISGAAETPKKRKTSKSLLRRVLGLPFYLIRGIFRLYRRLMIAYVAIALFAAFSALASDGRLRDVLTDTFARHIEEQAANTSVKQLLVPRGAPVLREFQAEGLPTVDDFTGAADTGVTQPPQGSSAKFSAAPKPRLIPMDAQ